MKKLVAIALIATNINAWGLETDKTKELKDNIKNLIILCSSTPNKGARICTKKEVRIIDIFKSIDKSTSIKMGDVCYTLCMQPEILPDVLIKLDKY